MYFRYHYHKRNNTYLRKKKHTHTHNAVSVSLYEHWVWKTCSNLQTNDDMEDNFCRNVFLNVWACARNKKTKNRPRERKIDFSR